MVGVLNGARIMLVFAALLAIPAWAEDVTICYNYGCAEQARVFFSTAQLAEVADLFGSIADGESERLALAIALGRFARIAGEQTPTFRDRGGNVADEGVDGRMDCIDHAHNATEYLRLLERNGWLRLHWVRDPVLRAPWLVNEHHAAHIVEKESEQEFAVDTWFFDNGYPATVLPLKEWRKGAGPDV